MGHLEHPNGSPSRGLEAEEAVEGVLPQKEEEEQVEVVRVLHWCWLVGPPMGGGAGEVAQVERLLVTALTVEVTMLAASRNSVAVEEEEEGLGARSMVQHR